MDLKPERFLCVKRSVWGELPEWNNCPVAGSTFCSMDCAGPESTSSIRQRMNGFTFGLGFGRSNQIFSRHHRFRMPAGQFGACLAIPVFDD